MIQTIKATIKAENRKRTKPLPVPDIRPLLQSDLGAPLPLHISLSRTLQIKTEDRESFLGTLDVALRRAAVQAFNYAFCGLKWVPNYERNRWFLVLGIEKPAHDELNRLLSTCNEAVLRSGFPALYAGGKGDGPMENNSPTARSPEGGDVDRSDRFHVSIAWNLEEPDPQWVDLVQDLDVDSHIRAPQASFDVVKARVGNVVHNFDLKTRKNSLGNDSHGQNSLATRRASLGLG